MTRNALLKIAVSGLVLGLTTGGCSGHALNMSAASAPAANPAKAAAKAEKQAAKARAAMKAGRRDQAVTAAEAAVALAPRDSMHRALLGQAYLDAGRFVSAERGFADAMDLGQRDASTILGLALSRIAQGQSDEAVALLDEHRALLPESDFGLALALAGSHDRAINVLGEAARTEGASPRLRQNLALSFALSGRWAQARILASQDMSPANVDQRMADWAKLAKHDHPALRVAGLIGVAVREDGGMPARLALQADAPVVQLAAADPAPLAEFAPPPPAETDVAPPAAPVAVASVDAAPVAVAMAAAAAPSFAAPLIAAEPAPYRTEPAAAPVAVAAAPVAAPKPVREVMDTLIATSIAAVSARQPTGWAVQLGAFRQLDAARQGWARTTRAHRNLSGYLATSHAATVKGRTLYRLTLHGIGTEAAARQLCGTLKGSGQTCFVRRMTGSEQIRWASREGEVKIAAK